MDAFDDDLLRQADYFSYIAVSPQMWAAFVKLAYVRDAHRGFLDLMAQLRKETK